MLDATRMLLTLSGYRVSAMPSFARAIDQVNRHRDIDFRYEEILSMEFSPLRRALLRAGLSASFLTLIPEQVLAQPLSDDERAPIRPGALPDVPFQSAVLGSTSAEDRDAICNFARSAIQAWQFIGMDDYVNQLPGIIDLKTQAAPSYLSEYQSAARLVKDARERFGSYTTAFPHLMFAERGGAAGVGTKLGRCRTFVFDEIVRHAVANGGFRNFGLVNYDGFISVSFYNEKSYRRSAP